MSLVNDPNTALVGALRPRREHPLWTALRRPFERVPTASDAVESIPGLRPRPSRWLWVGLLVAIGVGLAGTALETVRAAPGAAPVVAAASAATEEASAGERLGTTTLQMLPAPRPVAQRDPAAKGAADVAASASEPRPQPSTPAAAASPRAAKAAASSKTSAKKKPASRRLRRALGPASRTRGASR